MTFPLIPPVQVPVLLPFRGPHVLRWMPLLVCLAAG